MIIKDRLNKFRKLMKERNISYYLIPTSDFHSSEYVGDYFKQRQFMSNFTGSAATLLIGLNEARLWTDGRYFIQAEEELKDTSIILMKSQEDGVLSIEDYLLTTLNENDKLAFEGRYLSASFVKSFVPTLIEKRVTISYEEDLVALIWQNRPEIENKPAFKLDLKYCGESSNSKLTKIRAKMKELKATMHIITTLDDIAWIYNIRGNDVRFNPVALSYAIITLKSSYLFIDEDKLNSEILNQFKEDNVLILPYNSIYDFVKEISDNEIVLLDPNKVNYTIYQNIPINVPLVETYNPSMLLKATKNEVEIASLRNSHLKDGVAVAKFMYYLKNNVGKVELDELSAAEYLLKLRKEQIGFIEPSFNTICAYQDHGAIMHYKATEKTNYQIKNEGLLLVDSGGQYYDGTTDITRTYILGPIDDEIKKHYTLVLKGMINLSMAKFLYGCRGLNLDILAREPLWKLMLDYKSGTGHGVGFLLNVHEAPNGFRWKIVPERNDSAILEEGMVTTNEPGIYLEGKYGIRIENELVCKKTIKNEYGQFMEFETITYAPIDLDGVEPKYLNIEEINFLNEYHEMVYNKLKPYLNQEEKEFIRYYTRKI